MLKEQVQMPKDGEMYKEAGYAAWGLGLAIKPSVYGTIYTHGGNNGGFQSGFEYLKEKKTGFVFFTNCDKGHFFNSNLSAFLMK
jgi:CubicO group peptidase (beta-lactamase class C family)